MSLKKMSPLQIPSRTLAVRDTTPSQGELLVQPSANFESTPTLPSSSVGPQHHDLLAASAAADPRFERKPHRVADLNDIFDLGNLTTHFSPERLREFDGMSPYRMIPELEQHANLYRIGTCWEACLRRRGLAPHQFAEYDRHYHTSNYDLQCTIDFCHGSDLELWVERFQDEELYRMNSRTELEKRFIELCAQRWQLTSDAEVLEFDRNHTFLNEHLETLKQYCRYDDDVDTIHCIDRELRLRKFTSRSQAPDGLHQAANEQNPTVNVMCRDQQQVGPVLQDQAPETISADSNDQISLELEYMKQFENLCHTREIMMARITLAETDEDRIIRQKNLDDFEKENFMLIVDLIDRKYHAAEGGYLVLAQMINEAWQMRYLEPGEPKQEAEDSIMVDRSDSATTRVTGKEERQQNSPGIDRAEAELAAAKLQLAELEQRIQVLEQQRDDPESQLVAALEDIELVSEKEQVNSDDDLAHAEPLSAIDPDKKNLTSEPESQNEFYWAQCNEFHQLVQKRNSLLVAFFEAPLFAKKRCMRRIGEFERSNQLDQTNLIARERLAHREGNYLLVQLIADAWRWGPAGHTQNAHEVDPDFMELPSPYNRYPQSRRILTGDRPLDAEVNSLDQRRRFYSQPNMNIENLHSQARNDMEPEPLSAFSTLSFLPDQIQQQVESHPPVEQQQILTWLASLPAQDDFSNMTQEQKYEYVAARLSSSILPQARVAVEARNREGESFFDDDSDDEFWGC